MIAIIAVLTGTLAKADGTSEGISAYLSVTPASSNASQLFSNMNLFMYNNTTQITNITQVPESDYPNLIYKIQNTQIATKTVGGTNKLDLSLITIEFPNTLDISSSAVPPSSSPIGSPTITNNLGKLTYSYVVTGTGNASIIENFLDNISFTLNNPSTYPTDNSEVKVSGTSGDNMTTYIEDDGTFHLYRRYMFDEVNDARGQPHGTTVTWLMHMILQDSNLPLPLLTLRTLMDI